MPKMLSVVVLGLAVVGFAGSAYAGCTGSSHQQSVAAPAPIVTADVGGEQSSPAPAPAEN